MYKSNTHIIVLRFFVKMKSYGNLTPVGFLLNTPFTYIKTDNTYTPVWSVSTEMDLYVCHSLLYSVSLDNHTTTSLYIDNNPDFLVKILVKLMLRGLVVHCRNVVFAEIDHNNVRSALHVDIVCNSPKQQEIYLFLFCLYKEHLTAVRKHASRALTVVRSILQGYNGVYACIIPIYHHECKNKIIVMNST